MLNPWRIFYDLTYRISKPRWDTDVPPPELKALVENRNVKGRALDLGCGTGTNAIYMAKHGFTTVGVDFSPKAIKLAHEKEERANANVDFQVGDVTQLDFLREPFDLVLDVGCFHGLDAAGRARYARHVARLTKPGSKFLLWAFEHGSSFGMGATSDEIQQRFGEQFKLTRVEHGNGHVERNAAWYWLERKST